MKEIDDGGAAFPRATEQTVMGYNGTLEGERGMSLRDWFAGQALMGLCANPDIKRPTLPNIAADHRDFADICYQYADAMLAARKGAR